MANITATQAFTLVADAAYLSKRPLPAAPDGYYDWQVASNPAEKLKGHSSVTNLINRVSGFVAFQCALFDLSPDTNFPSQGWV